ncbi:MAG: selenide, water dikinase SelD [Bacteriovoracaceae bacterium]|nr:selenide, water dikinase SelD [Bacteriovoracaceae bacterium]
MKQKLKIYSDSKKVHLTQTVQKGGCAAKIPAATLREVLHSLNIVNVDPNILVKNSSFDDAAVYKINDELASIQTIDFFTPIVDTPYIYGRIAAVNALSDVYAMGGLPKTALAVLAFPLKTLDMSIMLDILKGAQDALAEAKSSLVGGHSIDDDTTKFGLAVTGHVHPKQMWTNSNALEGDHLILTKAIGTGTLTAGLKRGLCEDDIMDGLLSMCQLNNILDYLPKDLALHINAATDVTGFGLLGHSMQMAQASGVSFNLKAADVPILPGAKSSLEQGFLTRAHKTNREYVKPFAQIDETLMPWNEQLLVDPQTSGGLLLSVKPKYSKAMLDVLSTNFTQAQVVGHVTKKDAKDLYVTC